MFSYYAKLAEKFNAFFRPKNAVLMSCKQADKLEENIEKYFMDF